MNTSTKEQAIQLLFGKGPSKCFKARNVLQRLGQKYPDLMQEVADHAAGRIEEAGDNIPVGRMQSIRLEAETLGLRQCLLDSIIRDGLVDETGKPHEALGHVVKLTDQALRSLNALGLNPPPPVSGKDNPELKMLEAWSKALQTGDTITTTAPTTDTDSGGDADTDTDDNGEQEGGGDE